MKVSKLWSSVSQNKKKKINSNAIDCHGQVGGTIYRTLISFIKSVSITLGMIRTLILSFNFISYILRTIKYWIIEPNLYNIENQAPVHP